MTQLGELRDAWPEFEAAGIRLYAISYDDVDALAAFAAANDVSYPLLSDVDSEVIGRFGILNTEVAGNGAVVDGIPFPGTYVVDGDGVVVAKFFHDSYKKRESADTLLDSALGEVLLRTGEPSSFGGDDDVRVSATLHGGGGAIKQGAMRSLVVRFALREGLHIYGEPVPEGMVATSVEVTGSEGLVALEPRLPPTEPLRLEALDVELQVWSGTVDIVVPVYALSKLASELRPIDAGATVTFEVTVRYQACDDVSCLAPRSEKLRLEAPIEPIDVPTLPYFEGGGQRETRMDSQRHMRRLLLRKLRSNPRGFLRFVATTLRLEWAARRRLRARPEGSPH